MISCHSPFLSSKHFFISSELLPRITMYLYGSFEAAYLWLTEISLYLARIYFCSLYIFSSFSDSLSSLCWDSKTWVELLFEILIVFFGLNLVWFPWIGIYFRALSSLITWTMSLSSRSFFASSARDSSFRFCFIVTRFSHFSSYVLCSFLTLEFKILYVGCITVEHDPPAEFFLALMFDNYLRWCLAFG